MSSENETKGPLGNPSTEEATSPSRKRRGKKLQIIFSVIVIVAIAAGVGAWTWHEKPSFCGTVCHDTMGSYLKSWEDSDYTVHTHANADVVCLDCHTAELSTQIAELKIQLSGDYALPLQKMVVTDDFCLRDGCHTREEIESATTDFKVDGTTVNIHAQTVATEYGENESPHEVEGETLPCSTCHTMHRKSEGVDYCFSCHHAETFDSCYNCHDHR